MSWYYTVILLIKTAVKYNTHTPMIRDVSRDFRDTTELVMFSRHHANVTDK